MIQTITTPVTHKFNSFEVLRDSALPLRTKVAIALTNNDVIAFDLVHKHAYGATNIFVVADCYGEHCMNRMLTNKGGYNESDMRRHLREDILPLIPDDLKKLIIPRTIIQNINGEIAKPKNGPDLIWLPSITEVDAELPSSVDVDDVHFDFFDTEKSRIKEMNPHGTWPWWLRSATVSSTTDFEYVTSDGVVYNNSTSSKRGIYGVCFGFCI